MTTSNRRLLDKGITRAALYARVSTEEQAMHGISLDAQKERLIQYATENNLSIVGMYVDEGVSARKRYTRRAEFVRMINDVKDNKIDVILFIKLDRWFRNVADFYEVQSILDQHKVFWIATEEDYDTTTANGRLSLNIKLAIAQDEADRTSERIKFVFNNMVKDGRVISGTAPKGYKIVNKRPVVDEEMAEVVIAAYNKMADCRSMQKTQSFILDTYGIFWGLKEVKHILTNPWYIGKGHGVEGYCEAIIDEDLFNLVGNIISIRSERYDGARSDRVYLFTGLMFCGCCGRRMSTYSCTNNNKNKDKERRYIYYRCRAHIERRCHMPKQINQSTFEKWLVDNIATTAVEYNLSIKNESKKPKKKQIDTVAIRAKLERLKDLFISGLILKDMYEKDYTALTSLLYEAENEERSERKPIDVNVFKGFAENYWKLTEEQKKALWSRLIEKVIVTEKGDYIVTFNQP